MENVETVDMTMRSGILYITKIARKTQARVIKDWKVGDAIMLSVEASGVGSSSGRSYAVDVKVENLTQGTRTWKTFNTLSVLDAFELSNIPPEDCCEPNGGDFCECGDCPRTQRLEGDT